MRKALFNNFTVYINNLKMYNCYVLAFVYALLLIIPSFAVWFFINYLQRTNVVPSVFRFVSKTDLDIENVNFVLFLNS